MGGSFQDHKRVKMFILLTQHLFNLMNGFQYVLHLQRSELEVSQLRSRVW